MKLLKLSRNEKKNLEYQILQINQKGIIDKLNEDNKKKEKELHDKYIKEENQIENKYEKIVKLCKDEVSNININKNIAVEKLKMENEKLTDEIKNLQKKIETNEECIKAQKKIKINIEDEKLKNSELKKTINEIKAENDKFKKELE